MRHSDTLRFRAHFTGLLPLVRVGQGDFSPGANWLQFWYGRTLRIVGRLAGMATPSDRVLVIYGFSHVPLLKEFAEQSGFFRVIDPQPYLRHAVQALTSGTRGEQ